MPDIATNEPLRLRAGDTWKWKREDLSDYPAPTWVLKYRFKHPTLAGFEIVATADGANHSVTVTAATTTGYAAGRFAWLAWVESGTEKYSVDEGELEILPDLRTGAASATQDGRSDARKIHDDLLAAYKTYAATGGRVQAYTIGNRSQTFRSAAEILEQLNFWKAEVAKEEAAERLRNGVGSGNKLFVRLG